MMPQIHALLTKEFLSRIYYIKTAIGTGTAFSIYHDGKEFLISAKHCFEKGLTTIGEGENIAYYKNNEWTNIRVPRVLKSSNPYLDICAIPLETPLTPLDFPSISLNSVYSYGQECYFLGFPETWQEYKDTHQNEHDCLTMAEGIWPYPIPFIKRAIISKFITKSGIMPIYIDSITNKGFSGGPLIISYNGQLAIIGVVSQHILETMEVKRTVDEQSEEYKSSEYFTRSYTGTSEVHPLQPFINEVLLK